MKSFKILMYKPGDQTPVDQATLRATYAGVAVKRFLDGGRNLRFGTVDAMSRKNLGKGERIIIAVTCLG
jgi:hypothetical protein